VSAKHFDRSTCLRLTGLNALARVSLFEPGDRFHSARLEKDATFDSDEFPVHSRNVSMLLLCVRRDAGVFLGIDSEAISGSRRPTRQTARWVFCFTAVPQFPEIVIGTGGEVVNARVCKTRTRGFDSRPVLQSL
jgi:hypothetical protein